MAPDAQGRLWIVAPTQGNFTDIQSAVNAASDSDTILVRGGSYAGYTIDAKALTVVGDTGARHFLQQASVVVAVKNTRPGQSVVIRGFTGDATISVESCQGPVTLQSLSLSTYSQVRGSCDAVDSRAVTVVDCQFSHFGFGTVFGARGSNVYAYGSRFQSTSQGIIGASGGSAGGVVGGTLIAEGCAFIPGEGGPGWAKGVACAIPPGNGGNGLYIDPTANVELYSCRVEVGLPGRPAFPCPPGQFGQPFPGALPRVESNSTFPSINTPALHQTSQPGNIDVFGPPGAFAWLALGLGQSPNLNTPCSRMFYVDTQTLALVLLGGLSSSGSLAVRIPPLAGLAAEAVTLFVQPGTLTVTNCTAGRPNAMVLLR